MKQRAPLAVFVLVPLALVLWAVRKGGMLFGHDVSLLFYYNRALVGDALAHGRLPTWDPHMACGFPLMAAMQSAVFYPLTWPAAFLSPGAFWASTVVLHMALAGLFTYAWLRRGLGCSQGASLTGGVVFMLSGWLVTNVTAGHLPHLSVYAWLPAMMWRVERLLHRPTIRRVTLLAGATAMALFAGFAHFAFIGLIALAVRVGMERDWRAAKWTASALVLAFCLAAPQLLPTMELAGEAQRTSVNTYEFITEYSMTWRQMLTFVWPAALADELFIWEGCGFVGVAGLALAGVALRGSDKRRWMWAGLAIAGVLLALGSNAFVFRIFYALVPGFDLFRAPGRYLVLFTLAVVPLVALGFDRLRPNVAWGLAALLAVELLFFGARFFRGTETEALPWPRDFVDHVREKHGRVASPGPNGGQDAGRSQLAKLDHVAGYDALLLRRYTELMNVVHEKPFDEPGVSISPGRAHPVMYMLGARWWVIPGGRAPPAWRHAGSVRNSPLYEAPMAMPRAFVVPNERVMLDAKLRLAALADPSFDPSSVVVLEEPIEGMRGKGEAKIVEQSPGRLVVDVQATGGWLVFTEAWYPGWSARIDGTDVRVLRANHLVQAVPLPAGSHRVTFEYRSTRLPWGFALAVAGGVAALVLAIRARRKV